MGIPTIRLYIVNCVGTAIGRPQIRNGFSDNLFRKKC